MDAFSKHLFRDTSVRQEFHEFHLFRKIYVSALSVLFIDRRDHDLVAQHELVFDPGRHFVVRVYEGERFEVHIVR